MDKNMEDERKLCGLIGLGFPKTGVPRIRTEDYTWVHLLVGSTISASVTIPKRHICFAPPRHQTTKYQVPGSLTGPEFRAAWFASTF